MTEPTALTILPAEETPALQAADAYANILTMAEHFAGSQLCPKVLKGKPQDVAVVMLAGRDYGISDFQAVFGTGGLFVIDGKLSMEAQLMRALCLKSGPCEFIQEVESTPEKSTWATQRVGAPQPDIETFTLKEAQAQGLLKKPNWSGNPGPRTMLSHRCSARLCRRVYPDVLKGITYTPEELREGVSDDEAPSEGTEEKKTRVNALVEALNKPDLAPTTEPEPEGDPEAELQFEAESQDLEDFYLEEFRQCADAEKVALVYGDARARKDAMTKDTVAAIKKAYTSALARVK